MTLPEFGGWLMFGWVTVGIAVVALHIWRERKL